MPPHGPIDCTVPGRRRGLDGTLRAHGTIPCLARSHRRSVSRETATRSPIVAALGAHGSENLRGPARGAHSCPGGRPPGAGEIFRNPELAATPRADRRRRRRAVYRGALGKRLRPTSRGAAGSWPGRLRRAHLRLGRSDRTTYRGTTVYEMPPTAGLRRARDAQHPRGLRRRRDGHNSADYLHVLIEAKRIAFADGGAYLADPRTCRRRRCRPALEGIRCRCGAARSICDRAAPAYGRPVVRPTRDAATRWSSPLLTERQRHLLHQFALRPVRAGIVVPGTGIVLHTAERLQLSKRGIRIGWRRASGPSTRSCRRSYEGREAVDGLRRMGGDNQAQAHAQVVVNVVDFGMNVQEAGEPRACGTPTPGSASRARLTRRSGPSCAVAVHAVRTAAARWAGTRWPASTRRRAC